MKTFPFTTIGCGLGLLGSLAGCTHLTPSAQTQARIQEKATLYQQLKPEQQADILGGAIERGNTTDMVYLALGKPQRVVTSADGRRAMWVYTEYYSPGPAFTTGFNNPNSSAYMPGIAGENTPFKGDYTQTPAWQMPAGFHPDNGVAVPGTLGSSPVQSLVVAEMKSKTVYVFFHLGRVAEIKLDGDSSDQASAAPNVAQKKAGS